MARLYEPSHSIHLQHTSLSQEISCTINCVVGVTASTNPTKIARNKRHSQVLNVSNQMGNRPSRIGTIGVNRPGNQICHILIKIQSLCIIKKIKNKKKKRFNLYLKKIKKILQESSSHYKDSIFISKN